MGHGGDVLDCYDMDIEEDVLGWSSGGSMLESP